MLSFFLRVWNVSTCQAQVAYVTRPNEKHGQWFCKSFPGWQHFTCAVTTPCWGYWACPVWLHWERNPQRLLLFSQTSPHSSFLFVSFTLYALAVINYSHDCNYMLNAVSPPRESSNLQIVLGTSRTPTNRKPLSGVKTLTIALIFRLRIHNQKLFFLHTLHFKIIVDLWKLQK